MRARLLASFALLAGCTTVQFLPRKPALLDRSPPPAAVDSSASPIASGIPSIGTAAAVHASVAKEARLQNGIRVIMLEQHAFPLVALGVVLARGSVEAPPGIFDLFVDLQSSGSDLIAPKALTRTLSEYAARREVFVRPEASYVEVQFISPVLRDVVRMIVPTFATPTFDSDKFTVLLDEHRREASKRRDEPAASAKRELDKLLYGDTHPYAQDPSNDGIALAGVKLDTLRAMRSYIGADDVSVVAVGDFAPDKLLALLEQSLSSLRPGATRRKALDAITTPAAAHVVAIDHPGLSQAHIALGFVGVKYDDPDYTTLYCLARIVGDRANRALRYGHGLTYGASGTMSMRRAAAPVEITAAVNVGAVEPALHDMFDALRSFEERVRDPKELLHIKNWLLATWPDTSDTVTDAMQNLERLAAFDLPVDTWVKTRAIVEGLTADDLVRVAKKYLDPAHAQLVVFGDVARFKLELDALGLGAVEVRKAH